MFRYVLVLLAICKPSWILFGPRETTIWGRNIVRDLTNAIQPE